MPRNPIPYNFLYGAAVLVFIATAIVGAIQIADPTALGFSPVMARWIGVIASVLGVFSGVLPRINKPPDSERQGMD